MSHYNTTGRSGFRFAFHRYSGTTCPDRNKPLGEKRQENYCEHITGFFLGQYSSGGGSTSVEGRYLWDENRKYGTGTQDLYKYENKDGSREEDTSHETDPTRKALSDKNEEDSNKRISRTDMSPASKIRNVVVQKVLELAQYNIRSIPTGKYLKDQRNKMDAEIMMKAGDKEYFNQLNEMLDKPSLEEEYPFLPNNKDELDMYNVFGDYKLKSQTVIDNFFYEVFQNNEILKQDKENLIKDMYDFGAMAIAEYNKDRNGICKPMRIDPRYICTEFDEHNTHRDAQWGFYYDYITVEQAVAEGLNRKKVEDLVTENGGSLYQTEKKEDEPADTQTKYLYRNYAQERVIRIRFFWKEIEESYHETFQKEGKTVVENITKKQYKSKKKQKGRNTQLYTDYKTYIFEASRIGDTPLLYNYGISEFTDIPITFLKSNEKPISRQLIPIIDNYVLAWRKYQELIANIRDDTIVINASALEQLDATAKAFGEKDAIDVLKRHNKLLVQERPTMNNYAREPSAYTLPSSSQAISSILATFERNNILVQEIIGINDIFFGATPSRDTPVRTTLESLEASSNTIKIFARYLYDISSLSGRKQLGILEYKLRTDDILYKDLFSKEEYNYIKDAINNEGHFDVFVETAISGPELLQIQQELERAIQAGTISIADSYAIKRLIAEQRPKSMIWLMMDYATQKEAKRKEDMQKFVAESQERMTREKSQAEIQKTQQEALLEQETNKNKIANETFGKVIVEHVKQGKSVEETEGYLAKIGQLIQEEEQQETPKIPANV